MKYSKFLNFLPFKCYISFLSAIMLTCVPIDKSYGQTTLKNYVIKSEISIENIDSLINETQINLIGDAIGQSRIVMLGEQDHGDAPAYSVKSKLIKYLHEKKGFNVLIFESDFFSLNSGWDGLLKETSPIQDFIKKNIYPIWAYCNTCQELLYEYIPQTQYTNSPMQISGLDNQMYMEYTLNTLIKNLDSIFVKYKFSICNRKDYQSTVLPTIDSLTRIQTKLLRSSKFYERLNQYLDTIWQESIVKLDKNDFWVLVIENLKQLAKQYETLSSSEWTSNKIRDFQMAENLKWLANYKFKDQKIIVWAANAHIGNYRHETGEIETMGYYFSKDTLLKKETYILGFTSFGGTAGRLGTIPYKIREPRSNGFENWISKSSKFAFVDFNQFNFANPKFSDEFYLKALGHQTFFKHDWTKVFNGVFYIKEIYPCSN